MLKMSSKRDFGCGIRKAYVLLRVNAKFPSIYTAKSLFV